MKLNNVLKSNKGNRVNFSLVIACYNESDHLKINFDKLESVLRETKWQYEYIFVDDNSRDNTKKIIREIVVENPGIQIKCIFHERNAGRGQTVTDGLKISSGTVTGFLDIDLEIPAHYIIPAVSLIKSGWADFVMARRIYKYGFSLDDLLRHILSRGYNFLVRRMLRLPFKDTEAGFKFFNKDKILPILGVIEDKKWFWDTEIVANAHRYGFKIVLLPTLFIRDRNKKTTVRLVNDSLNYFVSLLKFRRRFSRQQTNDEKV